MDKDKQISEFLGSLVELENAIEKTLKNGVEHGLINGAGIEKTLSFYRLVVATTSHDTKKTKSED